MTLDEILNKGPQHVRHDEGGEFMLSVRNDDAGVIGIAPFALGGKCPRRGRHMMLPAFAREDYFSHLTIMQRTPSPWPVAAWQDADTDEEAWGWLEELYAERDESWRFQ